MTVATLNMPFTADDAQAAYDEWGCNCGPAALAFALQRPLSDVRYAIPDFDAKRYTNPTMMQKALWHFRIIPKAVTPASANNMFFAVPALIRIQWTGPWTQPGVNAKWGYRMTHWVTTFIDSSDPTAKVPMVFDVNGGIRNLLEWQRDIVPTLTALYPRADGKWFPTHVWKVT